MTSAQSSRGGTASQQWRIIDLIQWGQPHFESKNISNARLEIEWLLGHVLGLSRVELYVEFERPLMPDELQKIKQLVKRRTAGEPFQYIVGDAPFYGRDFAVSPAVLIPRPETEVMIRVLLKGDSPETILDVGTGCGCLAITAALELPESRGTAIDISSAALEVAAANADRLAAKNISFAEIDILQTAPEGKFDTILCNPPYIADSERISVMSEVVDHEPAIALFDSGDGLTFYRRLAELIPTLVNSNGRIIVEIGGEHQSAAVLDIFSAAGMSVQVYFDLQNDARVIEGRLG